MEHLLNATSSQQPAFHDQQPPILFSQSALSSATGVTPRYVPLASTAQSITATPKQKIKSRVQKRNSTDPLFRLPVEALSIAPPVSPQTPNSVTKNSRRHSDPVSKSHQKNKENYTVRELSNDTIRENASVRWSSGIPIGDLLLPPMYNSDPGVLICGFEDNLFHQTSDPVHGPFMHMEIESQLDHEIAKEIRNTLTSEVQYELMGEMHGGEDEETEDEIHHESQEVVSSPSITEKERPKTAKMISVSTQTASPLIIPSVNNFPVQVTTQPPQLELKEYEGPLKEILALNSKHLAPWTFLELTTIDDRWEFIQTIEKGVRDIYLRYGLPDGDKTIINIYMALTDNYTRDSLNYLGADSPPEKKIGRSKSLTELSQALDSHSLDTINTLTEFKLMVLLKGIPPLMIHTWIKTLLHYISTYPRIEYHNEFMALVRWISDHTIILQFIPTKTIHDLLVFSGCLGSLNNGPLLRKATCVDDKIGRWLTSLQRLAMAQPLTFFSVSS